jgi:hypothetical protein
MPRVGIAYRFLDKMVLRIGAGQYYNANQINNFQILNLKPPLSGSSVLQKDRVNPQATIDNPFAGAAGVAPTALLMLGKVQSNRRSKFLNNNIWQWTAEIERTFGKDLVLSNLVAHSGGKIIRGPQGAGLLIGRRDLVRAAWANSSPHHSFGCTLKVTKEEVIGMVRAVEAWRTDHDLQADFQMWKSWHAIISDRISTVPGVRAVVQGPVRGGPFPTLDISWDLSQVRLTAGEVGRLLLAGKPRNMTQAAGESHSFLLRPVAMKAGDYEIVARRLHEVFASAPKQSRERALEPPSLNITGSWDVEIQYEVGSARHQLFLAVDGNRINGRHTGWAYQGDIKGEINGGSVRFRSTLPADGSVLSYTFTGAVWPRGISGDVQMGEYGSAKWTVAAIAQVREPYWQ